jgi:hypothetical protein
MFAQAFQQATGMIDPYSCDAGILLAKKLHKPFDKFVWSINPKVQLSCKNIPSIPGLAICRRAIDFQFFKIKLGVCCMALPITDRHLHIWSLPTKRRWRREIM